jgi:uncharacterized protein (DUF1810 family)
MHEDFDLDRFVDAQRAVYGRAMEELRAGRKTTHWMWFMFPQLQGLGRSDIAQSLRSPAPLKHVHTCSMDYLGPD